MYDGFFSCIITDHENWFGSDEILGPLAISIKRERAGESSLGSDITTSHKDNSSYSTVRFVYRLIVRSTELNTLRGAILEESIPGIKPNSNKGGCHAKDVIEFLLPEIQLSCLKLGLQTLATEDQLLKLDQQILTHRHKVGIMYCKAGQATEEEMYNNEEAGPAFNEFLDLIGQRVRLKGFDKYTGGLDTKDDSTGLYTIYSQYQDCDVIFHVSTLLPFTPNNRQQLMRKRHIGNDIVTIVFQEPGALPFTPKNIRSQFQHVFIVVRAINPCSENACYSVSVSRSKEVPLFGPPIPEGAKFLKNKEFVDFLLAKVINAENATYRSEKFTTMATRTKHEYLKDVVSSYSSNTSIDPRPKFSMLPFGNKKKDMGKPKFNPDPVLRGALSWSVYLDDNSCDTRLDTYLAISTDSVVIIDAVSREPVFAIPCSSILGWNTSMCNTLRIYYHQGECVTLHSKEPASVGENDDLVEIVSRLEAVTRAKAGLKQGSRLVEICKVAVATLNQEQMIDFLKTSNPVIIMVVPPLPDGSPRRGCDAKHCIYTLDLEGEYENLNLNGSTDDEPPSLIHHQFKTPNSNSLLQQAVPGNHRKRYEPRSFSPPRSSNSSGYGTGSSSKSFSSASDPHFPPNPHEGETLTSSSSGMSSTDDRWYDLTENLDGTNGSSNNSPPPIPARNVNTTSSIIVTPQPVGGNQLVRPNSGTNISSANMGGNNNIVNKGNGAGRTPTLHNNNHPPFQNGTSVVVINKHGVNQNNLAVSSTNNNNNATCVNGNGASSANNGIYVSSPTTTAVNPLDKSFIAKRDFFQRNNPHHGSFHTKLSPSRSHDLLHLKSTYGIHHSQLKPFPNSSGGFEDYGALVASSPNRRFQQQDDSRILYEKVQSGGPMFNNSPLIENTVKGKVTYLTDFPLTHSHSSEYLVGYSAHDSPSHKDMNALKNERLAVLKSTYLDKHRERYDRDNESNKSRFSAPADSISGELNRSEDDLSLIVNGQPRSASMTGRITTSSSPKIANHNVEVKMRQPVNNGTPRQSANRNSTLQEDLMRLIAPDLIPTKNGDVVVSPPATVITNGPRPSSSGSVPITNGYVNIKARPVSCGGEPGGVAPVYNSPTRNALANANITPRNTQVINGHNHLASHGNNSVSTPRRPVEKEEGKIKTVPLPLLPDSGEVDWSTLVDTATKAFQCCDIDVAGGGSSLSGSNTSTATPPLKLNQSTNSPVHHASALPLTVSALGATPMGGNGYMGSGSNVSSCSSSSPQSILPWIDDIKPEENGDKLPGAPLESVFNLEARVSQLEAELRKEQQSKQVLAAKVANLQHENKILQEQSTTTQNQFKRFAEWLRNTGIPSDQNQNGSKNSKTVEANERI
ncbi:unnamed protein product [Allacma fusca]|uniref:Rap-GAP domain-containing protein n=1 Tax=Allacma fusca TaxID=39272 RepID=A0A8J2KTP3_9HEXA|nr:unnamed protein product [Allacma fusca]